MFVYGPTALAKTQTVGQHFSIRALQGVRQKIVQMLLSDIFFLEYLYIIACSTDTNNPDNTEHRTPNGEYRSIDYLRRSILIMRTTKEALLRQHAHVFWMCGLSGAGKSTLAALVDAELTARGYLCLVIDGDEVRKSLNKGLGFSHDDRMENLRRVAEVARMTAGNGIITIVSFISPTRSIREMVRRIVGNDYTEVFINAPLEVCEQRDTKGLYRKAREGKINEFTGIDSPFETPENPDIEINTAQLNINESLQKLLDFILPLIKKPDV